MFRLLKTLSVTLSFLFAIEVVADSQVPVGTCTYTWEGYADPKDKNPEFPKRFHQPEESFSIPLTEKLISVTDSESSNTIAFFPVIGNGYALRVIFNRDADDTFKGQSNKPFDIFVGLSTPGGTIISSQNIKGESKRANLVFRNHSSFKLGNYVPLDLEINCRID